MRYLTPLSLRLRARARTSCPKSGALRRTTRRVWRRWSAPPGFRRSWPSSWSAAASIARRPPATFSTPSSAASAIRSSCPAPLQAAEILHQAIADKKRIIVYGDYDADGMTATAILLGCLKLLGANADYYVPNRIDEGYGLNHEAIRSLALEGAQVVVTVDCGIASVAEAETATECGLTLIITDHHQPGRTAAARGGDRASRPARRRLSVRRPLRRGGRA